MPWIRREASVDPQPAEKKNASGKRPIVRAPAATGPQLRPTEFSEEEVPTGRLGDTQLRTLVERTSPQAEMPTLPKAMPILSGIPAERGLRGAPTRKQPAQASAPPLEAKPIVVLDARPVETPEIEILGVHMESGVVPTADDGSTSTDADEAPVPSVSVIVETRAPREGFLLKRLVAMALLLPFVATAAWTISSPVRPVARERGALPATPVAPAAAVTVSRLPPQGSF